MIKLNLGSGFIGLPDWINYDNSIVVKLKRLIPIRWLVKIGALPADYNDVKFPTIRVRDLRRGIPHGDTSVDVIFTSHFLEHLRRPEAVKLLKDCWRVLRQKGLIRVVVPDVDHIRSFKDGDDVSVWFYPDYINKKEPSLYDWIKHLFLRPHKWMYNYYSLRKILTEAGFKHVRRCNAHEGKCPDIDYLDTYPNHSLFVEAEKDEHNWLHVHTSSKVEGKYDSH